MQPYNTVNYCIALQGIFPSRDGLEPFIGEIMLFAGNFAPRGWALCDGQLLSISQNTALFSLLGTTYGGNGQTTFALPDLRGRVPIHPGQGPGLTPRSQGEIGGSETIVR
jgi:microcystin-dependent protein